MKTKFALLAVLLLGAAGHAHADTATITVKGKVLPGTCTMNNVDVDLDPIDAVEVKPGHDNKLKTASLTFTKCVGVGSIDLSFDGTDEATMEGHWRNMATPNGARGVAVALLDGATGPGYLKKGSTKTVAVNGAGTAKLDMGVGYFHGGAALVAGNVSAQITVTAVYK